MDPNTTLEEIQNRNHFVFKRLFEDLYEELVRYAHGYLHDMGSSEDVVQEVFIHIWERSEKIDIRTSLRAYFYTMVRNRCLNVLKAIKITDDANILELRAATTDSQYNFYPFTNEDKKAAHQEVARIMDALPTRMRTIVKLRFINNYRYAQIADELGISVNTVKTQLKRAKVKFGELIVVIICLLSILQ